MLQLIKGLLPNRAVRMRVWRGPFRGAKGNAAPLESFIPVQRRPKANA